MLSLYIWRHPKPSGVRGLCFGQLDVAVDQRKVKRLANQIDRYVKQHRLPKVIWVSHLQRSRQVGDILAKRGYQCVVDAQLAESYFGAWEGRPWSQISKAEVDAWCDDFAHFAPTGGESLTQLFARVATWITERQMAVTQQVSHSQQISNSKHADHSQQMSHTWSNKMITPILVVGHAGWMTTATMIAEGKAVPQQAKDWPMPAKYGELRVLHF